MLLKYYCYSVYQYYISTQLCIVVLTRHSRIFIAHGPLINIHVFTDNDANLHLLLCTVDCGGDSRRGGGLVQRKAQRKRRGLPQQLLRTQSLV